MCSEDYFSHQNSKVMSFPEKTKLNFKKCPSNLQMETFENYLKIVCTFKMMNTGFCVYYSEIQIRNTVKEI